jgi:hypothetical protein
LLPHRSYTGESPIQTSILASPHGEPLSSRQQAGRYPAGILERENVIYHDAKYDLADGLYYSKPVSEELLSEVHSSAMIERVKSTGI